MPSPDKLSFAAELLKGQSIQIRFDARRPGVEVPAYLTKNGNVTLQVGHAMAVPIPDLKVDAWGMSGTLSFKRRPFFVKVPWSAVFIVVGAEDNRGRVWEEDVPEDVRCP
jgi:stringent starvation protein B